MMIDISSYSTTHLVIFVVLILWEFVWKGLGLWRAGRKNQPVWFILILILNTMGILPIVYLILSNGKSSVKKKVIIKKRR